MRRRQLDRLARVHDVLTRAARRVEQHQPAGAAIGNETQRGVALRQADEKAAVLRYARWSARPRRGGASSCHSTTRRLKSSV